MDRLKSIEFLFFCFLNFFNFATWPLRGHSSATYRNGGGVWEGVKCPGTKRYEGVWFNQGSHMFSKTSNVLEFDLSVRVPSNVLEFNSMFSNVLETNCL